MLSLQWNISMMESQEISKIDYGNAVVRLGGDMNDPGCTGSSLKSKQLSLKPKNLEIIKDTRTESQYITCTFADKQAVVLKGNDVAIIADSQQNNNTFHRETKRECYEVNYCADDTDDIHDIFHFDTESEMLKAVAEIDELKARLAHAQDDVSFCGMSQYFESAAVNFLEGNGESFPPKTYSSLEQYCMETASREIHQGKTERDACCTNIEKSMPQQNNDPNRERDVSQGLDVDTVLRRKNAKNVFLEEGYQDFLNDALDALKRSEKEAEELRFELRDVKLQLVYQLMMGSLDSAGITRDQLVAKLLK